MAYMDGFVIAVPTANRTPTDRMTMKMASTRTTRANSIALVTGTNASAIDL